MCHRGGAGDQPVCTFASRSCRTVRTLRLLPGRICHVLRRSDDLVWRRVEGPAMDCDHFGVGFNHSWPNMAVVLGLARGGSAVLRPGAKVFLLKQRIHKLSVFFVTTQILQSGTQSAPLLCLACRPTWLIAPGPSDHRLARCRQAGQHHRYLPTIDDQILSKFPPASAAQA